MEDKEPAFTDVEVYGNAALFMCKTLSGRWFKTWITERDSPAAEYIDEVMASPYVFITFNGIVYDFPIIRAMIDGRGPHELKHLSNRIVEGSIMPWDAEREFKLPPYLAAADHIDLIGAKPPFVGLKMCAARMGSPHIEENPIEHTALITPTEYPKGERYCASDINNTEMLFKRMEQPLLLRCEMSKQYGVDLRSKTDSQVAEQVFIKRLRLSRRDNKIPPYIRYTAPVWAKQFKHPLLVDLVARLEDTIFHVHQGTGHVAMPEWLEEMKVNSSTGTYKLGIGGLHSTHDKKICYVARDGRVIDDVDLASYYPTLIVNADPSLLPPHLGVMFINEYDGVRVVRLEAKRAKNMSKADSLRIAVNGTFGKLMSRWSPLYAPALGLYTVLSGQLGLLGCIFEVIEPAGGEVLSANTDGIVIGHREGDDVLERVMAYGKTMSEGARAPYEFEDTRYRVIAMKDVNNYMAIKAKDRSVKAKGLYAPLDKMMKNPTLPACSEAVGEWLAKGTPFNQTLEKIAERRYLPDWMAARNVTDGGMQGEQYIGGLVRWYLSTDKNLPHLTYRSNGNKVPKTDGVRACMVFDPVDPLPVDLDFIAYNKECIRIAIDLGCKDYLTEEQLQLVAKVPKPRKQKAVKPVDGANQAFIEGDA